MQQKKIGLYGGAFDPVHNMHINIAEKTLDQLGLDEVWFLADKIPRRKQQVTDYQHRLEMLRLATQHNKKLITNELPVQKTGTTHSITTLRQFLNDHPGYEFTIISGLDSILYLEQWENHEEFIENAGFAVIKRPGYEITNFVDLTNRIKQKSLDLRHTLIDINPSHLSSANVRKNHASLNKLVHPEVAEYIRLNKLY